MEWWRANSGRPDLLEQELETTLALVAQHPGIGRPYVSARTKNVQCVYLRDTHYFIYYRTNRKKDLVDVLAVWHSARGKAPPV